MRERDDIILELFSENVIVAVFGARAHSHFGGPPASYAGPWRAWNGLTRTLRGESRGCRGCSKS